MVIRSTEKKYNVLILFALIFIFYGCARRGVFSVQKNYTIRIPSGVIEKIPMRVGLYMSPMFHSNYLYPYIDSRPMYGISIDLGGAMVDGALRTLNCLFKEVKVIGNIYSPMLWNDVDVIITPDIIEQDARYYHPGLESFVICKWTITDKEGNTMYINAITGKGDIKKSCPLSSIGNCFEECLLLAIQDHYQKLADHLLTTHWWEK